MRIDRRTLFAGTLATAAAGATGAANAQAQSGTDKPVKLMLDRATELKAAGTQYIPKDYDPTLYKLRHSLAHVLAQAVVEKFPQAKPTIGPPIEYGFYYDFDLDVNPTDGDLEWIANRMRWPFGTVRAKSWSLMVALKL